MSDFGGARPKVVLLFGAPGTGKGTVGSMLCAAGNHYHLSSGDIFRRISPESEFGKTFHDYASRGELVPDKFTLKVLKRYTKGLIDTNRFYPSQQMLILDGFPRTTQQAVMIDELVDVLHVIVLEVHDENEIIRRITRRGRIEKRQDDVNESIIRNRISEYKKKTIEVLSHYSSDKISYYNAGQTPMEVLRDVLVGSTHILKSMPDLLPHDNDKNEAYPIHHGKK